jgi:hypothetical protein
MPEPFAPSLARDLFDRILEGDSVAILHAMVETEKTHEREWLEFKSFPWDDFKDPMKGCGRTNLKDQKKDLIKRTWSETLSAFANTDGGVLIWGIHAHKNADGIDAAHSFQLVPSPSALRSRLDELLHDAADPPVPGVRIEAFEDPNEGGMGFVVCFVPASPYAPHRAEHADKNYYMRWGSSTAPPSVSVLRRLFYPRHQPVLSVRTQLSYIKEGQPPNRVVLLRCHAEVENLGNATAKNIHIGFNWDAGAKIDVLASPPWLKQQSRRYQHAFVSATSLHPGFSYKIMFSSDWRVSSRVDRTSDGTQLLVPVFDPISFQYFLFAEDYEPHVSRVAFSRDDFSTEKTVVERVGEMAKLDRDNTG